MQAGHCTRLQATQGRATIDTCANQCQPLFSALLIAFLFHFSSGLIKPLLFRYVGSGRPVKGRACFL